MVFIKTKWNPLRESEKGWELCCGGTLGHWENIVAGQPGRPGFFFQSIKACWYICMQTSLSLTSSGLNRSDISWLAAFHVTYQNKSHPPHGLILWDEVVWGAQRFGIPLWPKELIFEVMKWSRLSCGWCFRLLLHLTVAGLEPQRFNWLAETNILRFIFFRFTTYFRGTTCWTCRGLGVAKVILHSCDALLCHVSWLIRALEIDSRRAAFVEVGRHSLCGRSWF